MEIDKLLNQRNQGWNFCEGIIGAKFVMVFKKRKPIIDASNIITCCLVYWIF